MQIELIVFQLAVLIFSIMVHEIAHGAVAYYLGDDTAYRLGRLTLNPLKHIDPFGSIILPAILSLPLLFGARPIIVGWAKPVPYNPNNLENPRRGAALIALAGPASNITLAIIFALIVRLAGALLTPALTLAFQIIIVLNLMLAVFNLVPIPPLDGSKIFPIPFLERNALVFLMLFIIFGLPAVQIVVNVLYVLLMGAP